MGPEWIAGRVAVPGTACGGDLYRSDFSAIRQDLGVRTLGFPLCLARSRGQPGAVTKAGMPAPTGPPTAAGSQALRSGAQGLAVAFSDERAVAGHSGHEAFFFQQADRLADRGHRDVVLGCQVDHGLELLPRCQLPGLDLPADDGRELAVRRNGRVPGDHHTVIPDLTWKLQVAPSPGVMSLYALCSGVKRQAAPGGG